MDSSIERQAQLGAMRTAARADVVGVAVFAALSLFGGLFSAAGAAEQKRLDVLELFTSQGCSSCPPADVLLEQFSRRDDVLALSFPVSYWDHLGWRDTLAKDAYNERQRNYAADARRSRDLYAADGRQWHRSRRRQPEECHRGRHGKDTAASSAPPGCLSRWNAAAAMRS